MNQKQEVIHSLNQLIQGEYMSINAFDIYISKVQNGVIKKTFQSIQDQHRENVKNLACYIQKIGGQANENIGLKGTMSNIKMNIQTSSKIDPSDYIKKAIEGMTTGIHMTEDLLRGDLDEPSRQLVGQILEKDRQSIEILDSLKS